MRKTIIAVLAALALLSGLACEAEEGSDPPSSTQRNNDRREPTKKPTQPVQPTVPHPGEQVPAPAADPMACNPGQECDESEWVKLRLAWFGERGGTITLYLNGSKSESFAAPRPEKFAGSRVYTGLWERNISLSGISSVGFDWAPNGPLMPAQCMIYHKGQPVDFMTTDKGGPCAVNWTVTY